MGWLRKHREALLIALAAVIGFFLLLYPTVSDWWNGFHQSRVVMSYAESVAGMSEAAYRKCLKDADAYNNKLAETGILWQMDEGQRAEYDAQLNFQKTGVMGYVSIPKIGITLPIYHSVDEAVLQVAIGHIPGTSLPVGGKGTHTVISGHRGLPTAKLFTDIDKLTEGDTWTITVLDRTITYECDQIRVVEPTDLSEITIDPEKDFCTLVTCTPYGINTQRLLVRGHRVSNAQGDAQVTAEAIRYEPVYLIPFVCAPVLVLFFFLSMWRISRFNRRRAEIRETMRQLREYGNPEEDRISMWKKRRMKRKKNADQCEKTQDGS